MRKLIPPAAVLLIALVASVLSLAPTWQGYLAEPDPAQKFLGFRYMAGDHYQYAGFIRQARDTTALFMTNPFTTEPQRGAFLLLYFWILGVTCRLSGLSVTAAWELFRVAGAFLYIVAFWYFTTNYLEKARTRILATALFAFGGGLGWLVTLLRLAVSPALKPLEYPYDYYWNWCTFGTMIVPNWIWPALCLLMACHAVVSAPRARAALTFLLLPTVWFLHAYSGMVAYAMFGLLPLMPVLRGMVTRGPIPWARARAHLMVALPGLLSFAVVGVYLLWARSDAVFSTISRHGFLWTDSFKLWWYPLGYGAILPLAWRGRSPRPREDALGRDLILSWLLAAFLLSVQPFYAGVKFQYLLFPPLALLAARGLWEAGKGAPRKRQAKRLLLSAALLAILFLDAPVSLFKDYPAAGTDPWIFSSTADLKAMKFLDGREPGVVLTSYKTGNRVPWLTGKAVFLGHWFMTIDHNRKFNMVGEFFSPQTPIGYKREILSESGARYVYRGFYEASLGWRVDPALSLRTIYEDGPVVIYERPGF